MAFALFAQMREKMIAGPPLDTPDQGVGKDGRPRKDVSNWSTYALDSLAWAWKDQAEVQAKEMSYDQWEMHDWAYGIGPRDAMRAG